MCVDETFGILEYIRVSPPTRERKDSLPSTHTQLPSRSIFPTPFNCSIRSNTQHKYNKSQHLPPARWLLPTVEQAQPRVSLRPKWLTPIPPTHNSQGSNGTPFCAPGAYPRLCNYSHHGMHPKPMLSLVKAPPMRSTHLTTAYSCMRWLNMPSRKATLPSYQMDPPNSRSLS